MVILAAGQGKRMHSNLPKVLHPLAGKPLLEHVIDASMVLTKSKPIVIYGHQGDLLTKKLVHREVQWVLQEEQLGTGHAVQQALPKITDDNQVLILCGDVPLISSETLTKLIETTPPNAVGMLTAHLTKPFGYGRIKRDANHHVVGVVEEKDATPTERDIHEINTGIYFLPAKYLKEWLPALQNNNAQKEYYLTDIIKHAFKHKIAIHAVHPADNSEIMGVNDRIQLAYLERCYQKNAAESLMRKGVTLRDPARVDIRGEVEVGRDVTIDVNVIFEGRVVIGDECTIGPNVILRDTIIGNQVVVRANTTIHGAKIANKCIIGPFARIRPDSVLEESARIGNFVEIKKTRVGKESKANHLSYIGDCDIGTGVNIGAGTITCNYDGVTKHQTIIGDNAFIGSCSQLVAPVMIGAGATIGAGSTITEDAPANKLTLSRARQHTVAEWKRPEKKEA